MSFENSLYLMIHIVYEMCAVLYSLYRVRREKDRTILRLYLIWTLSTNFMCTLPIMQIKPFGKYASAPISLSPFHSHSITSLFSLSSEIILLNILHLFHGFECFACKKMRVFIDCVISFACVTCFTANFIYASSQHAYIHNSNDSIHCKWAAFILWP